MFAKSHLSENSNFGKETQHPTATYKTDQQPKYNKERLPKQNQYVLLPVGGQYSLGLVVAGQPVDPALNENQTELGIFVLQV